MSRRKFLGTSATVAGVAATAPLVLTAATAPADQVTVGVMGLSRGLSLAETFGQLPGVRVKYVCDVDAERAAAGMAHLQQETEQRPEAIGDFRRILDDPEVDALVCAAPNHWHAPATILACAAGKHVYVEKPCSHNPWEGETMVAAARAQQRVVQVGTQRRSGPGFIAAVDRLREGVIGRVYLARCWYNNLRPTIGRGQAVNPPQQLNYDLWQGPAPRVPYVDNRLPYNWHWFWHWGNGELGNNGVHTLDVCRWGLGVDFPVRVTSSGGRYRFPDDDQQTPDTQVVAFEFEGGLSITWQGLSCSRHGSGFVAFYGEQGSLELEPSGQFTVFDAQESVVEQSPARLTDAVHVENFLAAIRAGNPQILHAEVLEGHKSALLCHLGNIAHRTGRVLRCSATDGHILADDKAAALWKREYEPGWEPRV